MTTITTPNFFASATATTPAWIVPNGMTAKVIDAAGAQTITIAAGGKLDLDASLGANIFIFEGISDPVTALRNGTEVLFSTTLGGVFASIPASTTAQSVKFGTAAAVDLQIASGVVKLDGVAVESVPVDATFTVTNTAGVLSFGGTATGVVTVTNNAGTLTFVRDGVTATTTAVLADLASNGLPAVTVSGTTTTAADANSFDAKSTEIITATLSDTPVNLATLTGTGNAYTVTLSGTTVATVAQLKTINNATTGAITLNTETIAANLTGSAADLAAAFIGITSHTGTLTITDVASAPIAATTLSTIGSATSGVVTVTNAIAISGTIAEATAALVTGASLVVAGSATVTLSDVGTAAALALKDINSKTTGLVTAAGVTTLTGLTADITTVTAAMGISGDKIALAGLTTLQPSDAVSATSFDSTIFTQTDVTITLANVASNALTMADATVLPGAVLKVNGAALTGTNALTFDGALEASGKFSVTGGAGDDTIIGGAGNDTITGGAGNDSITGGAGADTFNVDAGTDSITDFGNAVDILVVSSGATANATMNTTTPSWTATAFTTNAGVATFITAASTTTATIDLSLITTNSGTVTINAATASSATTLKGTGAGVTNITGGSGVDTITAAVGGGSITGGAGNDVITLGAGVDTVVFSAVATNGNDTITGFTAGATKDILNVIALATLTDTSGSTVQIATAATTSGTAVGTAKAWIVTDATASGFGSYLTDLGAAMNESGTGSEKSVFVLSDGTNTRVYLYQNDGTDNTVQAGELTLVGTLNGVLASAFDVTNVVVV